MRRHRAYDGACDSGCNYDSELVWSSTLCGEGPSFIARMSSPGDKQASADSKHILPGGSDLNYRVYAVRGRARVHGAPDGGVESLEPQGTTDSI